MPCCAGAWPFFSCPRISQICHPWMYPFMWDLYSVYHSIAYHFLFIFYSWGFENCQLLCFDGCIRCRFFTESVFLYSLMDFGVTSTISSSFIKFMAFSRVMGCTGEHTVLSSFPAARMFVSFFSLLGFAMISTALLCSPIIIPAYTDSPGAMKRRPLGSR